MKLLFLLTLILGGFSLPANAAEQLDKCADYKLMKSNDGMLIIRRRDTGENVFQAVNYKEGKTIAREKFEEVCSD